jgi:two-component system, response regulator
MDTRTKIVAVAEDDPDDRLLLKDAFVSCGPDVQLEFFENGPDLLDYLHSRGKYIRSRRRPHLIIMDFYLPGTNALELIEAVKSDPGLRPIPLVVLTGTCPETDVSRCYDLGANTVIIKPETFSELLQSVKRICDYWFAVAKG